MATKKLPVGVGCSAMPTPAGRVLDLLPTLVHAEVPSSRRSTTTTKWSTEHLVASEGSGSGQWTRRWAAVPTHASRPAGGLGDDGKDARVAVPRAEGPSASGRRPGRRGGDVALQLSPRAARFGTVGLGVGALEETVAEAQELLVWWSSRGTVARAESRASTWQRVGVAVGRRSGRGRRRRGAQAVIHEEQAGGRRQKRQDEPVGDLPSQGPLPVDHVSAVSSRPTASRRRCERCRSCRAFNDGSVSDLAGACRGEHRGGEIESVVEVEPHLRCRR